MPYTRYVEFVGGPLDGYTFILTDPTKELVPLATLPISANTFRWMAGETPVRPASPTSLAVYVREVLGEITRFCFVRCLPTSQMVSTSSPRPEAT